MWGKVYLFDSRIQWHISVNEVVVVTLLVKTFPITYGKKKVLKFS